jgi:hypothetical protein
MTNFQTNFTYWPALTKRVERLVLNAMLSLSALALAPACHGADPIKVPLTADRWEVTPENVEFSRPDGYPLGTVYVKKGAAVLKDFTFRSGTIEFDVTARGSMGAGIGFRRRDDQTYEDF